MEIPLLIFLEYSYITLQALLYWIKTSGVKSIISDSSPHAFYFTIKISQCDLLISVTLGTVNAEMAESSCFKNIIQYILFPFTKKLNESSRLKYCYTWNRILT